MDEGEFTYIKGKIVGGVFALTSRTFLLQSVSFLANFILTILLTPSVFGVYFVVSAVISFLSYFSDVGLAAALIQEREKPTEDELVSTFTIQQLLIGITVILSYALSGTIAQFYKLDSSGLFLLRALVVSFFLSSLKTIPSILLERNLEFGKLIIPQILETVAFYLVVILLAFYGKGISSFAWGAIARGIVGLVSIYYISPWKIRFGINVKSVKKLMSFGIPFQANSLLALIKDDLMTIFLGKILPFHQIGYIGWAKKWAEVPLRLIMDSVMKVSFPAYSRLAADYKLMRRALEKSLFFLALFIFPSVMVMIMIIAPVIQFIPKYSKWDPALTSFYLFAVASVFAAFSSPIVNALNALGKIKITLALMVVWTCLTWLLIPFLVSVIGFNGVALAAVFISGTSFLPYILIRRFISFNIFNPVKKPLLATIIMSVPLILLINISANFMVIINSLIISLVVYVLTIWLIMRKEISPYLPKAINQRLT